MAEKKIGEILAKFEGFGEIKKLFGEMTKFDIKPPILKEKNKLLIFVFMKKFIFTKFVKTLSLKNGIKVVFWG